MKRLSTFLNGMTYSFTLALFALPTSSMASTLESVINNGVDFLQGTLARAVGGAVVVGAGYLCFRAQKLPIERFVHIVVGLGLIYGGPALYSQLVG